MTAEKNVKNDSNARIRAELIVLEIKGSRKMC